MTDPPATRPDSPSARLAVAQVDTGSVAPVTRDAPDLDFGHDDESFFTKSLDDVHAEELRRSAPDLHEEQARVARARRPRIDHRRARSIVVGVLGVCALIGATAMVRRSIAPSHRGLSTESAIAHAAAAPPAATVAAPQLELPTIPTAVAEQAEAPAEQPAPTQGAEPTVVAPAAEVAAQVPPPVAATSSPTGAKPAAAAPSDDPDSSSSGAQLLAAARTAINGNNAPRAAALARKAIAKGAGGSAQYVLGAAYQAMGANAGAKGAYGACARSGAAEASECAALVDSL